jgi:hypothetical protein
MRLKEGLMGDSDVGEEMGEANALAVELYSVAMMAH